LDKNFIQIRFVKRKNGEGEVVAEKEIKKVLVIVYYWPPSGGAGVQRWLKFVKYLPQFDWQPTVITTLAGDYPALDTSLLADVPANVKVVRTKTPTFGKFFNKKGEKNLPYGSLEIRPNDSFCKKITFWIRLNLIVPDARKFWNKYAYKAACQELRKERYEAIITSGPPHSTHLVGRKLKQKFGVKWLADFRDPWTKIDYLEKVKRSKLTAKLDRKLEAKVVHDCDLVLSINQKILHDLAAGEKGKIISNGFDASDFAGKKKQLNQKFTISYFGNITGERNPAIVLQALNYLTEFVSNLQLDFWGNVSRDVQAELLAADKNHLIVFHDYISHEQVLQEMIDSDLLLLIINNVPDNKGILTGKIYEYLGAGVPVLGIGPIAGEAAEILQKTNAGQMFDYKDENSIKDFIARIYENRLKGRTADHSAAVGSFSRQELTKELAEILASMCE